MTVGMCNMN